MNSGLASVPQILIELRPFVSVSDESPVDPVGRDLHRDATRAATGDASLLEYMLAPTSDAFR